MIEVIVRNNTQDAFDKALRKFKKDCNDAGFIQELRDRQYFKSEGEKKREKRRKKEWDNGRK